VIRPLAPADAEACDAIVLTLPYHFGDEGGRDQCARAVRTQQGLVAVEDGDVVGFLTLDRHDPRSAEITWMAVRADRRGRGIGRRLIERCASDLSGDGVEFLSVLTVAESEPDWRETDNYADTRAFYRALGFVPLRELALEGWDERAVILVRPVP
jgi:N-acetylglutamate synthase-like GNAT family acetyltransferase